jgi:hypothetical protein
MKTFMAILASLLLIPTIALAQNMVARPVDEAAKEPSFLAYRTALIKAVNAQDTEAVVQLSTDDIHLSFGGHSGHQDLRNFLNVPEELLSDEYKPQAAQMRQDRWKALKEVLKLGGRFEDGDFVAPYTWTAKLPENADTYETHFIMGENVLLRGARSPHGRIKQRLSYNIVYAVDWIEGETYQGIELPDGTTGFVSKDYLRHLLDYRAIFSQINGEWRMRVFIAGD